ncbi:MAG: adenosylmethionine decarboxylase [Deltaproteobacteria bacterium]|nr:adenosylmethionine decarboxylase [Deltaproteobacteria bacterium]
MKKIGTVCLILLLSCGLASCAQTSGQVTPQPGVAYYPLGKLLFSDMEGIAFDKLNDPVFLKSLIERAVKLSKLNLVNMAEQKYEPYGVSILANVREGHITITTWPEFGYAAVDVLIYGKNDPADTFFYIKDRLGPIKLKTEVMDRGPISTDLKPQLPRRLQKGLRSSPGTHAPKENTSGTNSSTGSSPNESVSGPKSTE